MPKFTFHADGEANFYTVMKDDNWFAKIQFNGELHTPTQEAFTRFMTNAVATVTAVKSLLSDIEGMRFFTRDTDDENSYWFGPFSEHVDAGDFGDDPVRVEWPNLSIAAADVQKLIDERVTIIDHQDALDPQSQQARANSTYAIAQVNKR